jgi:hypothetical protein
MRKRTITVKQYTNETKLMSLVPDHIKKVKLRESFITEIEYIKSRSNKMTVEQKALAVTKALKKSLSELQWEAAKRMLATDDLSEGEFGKLSDDQVATMIANAAKELASSAENPEVDLKSLDASDINLDVVTDLKAIQNNPEDLVKQEWATSKKSLTEKTLLKEFVISVTLLLAAPTIAKGIANMIDWIGGLITGTPESRGTARIYRKLYTVSKKLKQIPPQTELDKQLGGIWNSAKSGVSYKDDQKYTAAVYAELEEAAKKTGETFNANSTESQPASDSLIHHIEERSSYTKLGGWLKHKAHQLHELYIIVIQSVCFAVAALLAPGQVVFKPKATWEKCHNVAEWIYALGMLCLAIYGGIHAWHDFLHAAPEMAKHVAVAAPKLVNAFTVLVDAIKAGDMSVSVISKIGATFAG